MRCAIVIPSRYGSSRLRGKPLLRVTGKYLIQHVYENALRSRRADEVVVATDDPRIVAAVRSFGGKVVLTRRDHPSGTDRVAEVAQSLMAEVIVNLQGDEPDLDPSAIDLLPTLLERDPDAHMATLAVAFRNSEEFENPNCVKVIRDRQGRAIYFSRSPVPFVRDRTPDFSRPNTMFLHHLGIYAYRREALLELASMPPDVLEQAEKLEQLRAIGAGWKIQVGVIAQGAKGVDTVQDYRQFVANYRSHRLLAAA